MSAWDATIAHLPRAHLLQSSTWAEFKGLYGWRALAYVWPVSGPVQRFDPEQPPEIPVLAAAMLLQRTVSVGGLPFVRLLYAPKGPLLDWEDASLRQGVLSDLQSIARQQSAAFIKIDPDVILGTGIPGSPEEQPHSTGQAVAGELLTSGWRFSDEQVQFRNTVLLDLSPAAEVLLAAMKQKTRYNIRLASRKGVSVRPAGTADLDTLYQMYAETSVRDGFVIREQGYYLSLWRLAMAAGLAQPLVAEWEGQPVAGLVLFSYAGRGYFLHGMSRTDQRDKMAGYLLQWEAINRLSAQGCHTYDLWGAPETFDADDALAGVYRFKEGYAGQLVRTLGAYDYPVKPSLYRVYTELLPRLLEYLRRRQRKQTAQALGA